jgi:hypothetical protein
MFCHAEARCSEAGSITSVGSDAKSGVNGNAEFTFSAKGVAQNGEPFYPGPQGRGMLPKWVAHMITCISIFEESAGRRWMTWSWGGYS